MEDLQIENTCYVLVQTNVIHPCADPMRHEMIWYPERAMTLLDCVQYRPYIKSIVTENAWLISCYDRKDVRVFSKEFGWITPDIQTYGASINHITMSLLGVRQTIPSAALDGGKEIKILIKKLEDEYQI